MPVKRFGGEAVGGRSVDQPPTLFYTAVPLVQHPLQVRFVLRKERDKNVIKFNCYQHLTRQWGHEVMCRTPSLTTVMIPILASCRMNYAGNNRETLRPFNISIVIGIRTVYRNYSTDREIVQLF